MADEKILLVEDECIAAMDIKRTLEFFGYEVPYVASSGDEAVEKALEIMPDLILMDIFLKEGSDGIVAASKIKDLNIPLIYLTAHSEERTVERSKLTEPYGYMIKPYDSIELKYAIELAIYKNKIKKELKESEKSYRELVNTSMVAIYKTNLKGDIIFANNAMAELFDFKSVEALKRKKIPQLYKNPKDRKKFIKKLRKEGSFNHYEVNMVSNSGETITILLSAQLEDNTISGMIIDITERKRTENDIIRAKEEWENTFDAVPDLIAILDTNFRVVRANKAMADKLNVTPKETVGLTCYEMVHGLTAPPAFCPYSKLLEDGQEHTAEVHEDRIGGDFIVSVSPLHDKDGKLMGSVHVARDINKRKKAEKLLKESEEKFRAIFQNANDMISLNLMNEDGLPGRFLEVNEVASERLGYTYDELMNMGPKDIVAPEARTDMPENAAILIEKGHNTFEIVHLTKTGERIPVEVNNHLIQYKGNKVCLAISRDITERKNAEKAINESEKKYRTIFENVQDIFYQTDINGKIIEISPSVKRYSRYKRKDLIGKQVDMIYDNPEERKNLLKAIHDKGEVFDYELMLKEKDGHLVYASVNAHFIFDSNNRPIGVEGSIRDINKRKNAEEALKVSQFRLANAMDLAHLASWELDLSTNMFIFNDRFYSMLGTTVENEGSYHMSIKDYARKYVHHEDTQFVADGLKASLDARESVFGTEVEHRIRRMDGKIRYMVIHIRIIPPTTNRRAYVYGSVQDITDRKIVEEKLKESIKEKEMLLKEIHHRVKNNLMVISSLLNLQSSYIKDKQALDIFKESQNRAKSMALIHERLYRSTDLRRIDFGDYIQTLSNDLFHTYVQDPSRVKLNMKVENVMVDINTTVPLGLIVNELVTNSMKHAFVNGHKGKINIDFHKDGDLFILIVGDSGVGFPEDLDFRNTDSLGLQLVNNLTGQIDGTIELNRKNGTEFKITFKELYK